MYLPHEKQGQLSPVRLAGRMIAPLPLFPLQPILSAILGTIHGRHPDLFDRLSSLDDPSYLIDPVDLPMAFVLSLNPDKPQLIAVRNAGEMVAAATIRGPVMRLIDLLQGQVDGDALFFSRQLVIEGDTEAIVALRNAVESIEIDLMEDLLSALGPFRHPARHGIALGSRLFNRASRDLGILRSVIRPPNSSGQSKHTTVKTG